MQSHWNGCLETQFHSYGNWQAPGKNYCHHILKYIFIDIHNISTEKSTLFQELTWWYNYFIFSTVCTDGLASTATAFISYMHPANESRRYKFWSCIWTGVRDHSGYGLGQWEKALHDNGYAYTQNGHCGVRYYYRADSRIAPSQCETSLQSNNRVSDWLGVNQESVLYYHTAVKIQGS